MAKGEVSSQRNRCILGRGILGCV